MKTNQILLDVKDLKVQFDIPEGIVHAVNNVSFKIHEGETVGIVGESGCGKSVTMMSILGLIPIPPGKIANGKAIFNNQDLLTLEEDKLEKIRGRDIGLIFQDPMTSLNPVLTLEKQLTEAISKHYGMDSENAKTKALRLMEMVGIPAPDKRLKNYPHQFSGGMRQRVIIAMMLALNPSLLIADEPTTALDVTIQAQIVELVKDMKKEFNMAMIWITHDLGVIAGLAERVIVMYAGMIVEEADVDTLYNKSQHPYTLALLSALPRVDQRRNGRRLKAIPGVPPNLLVDIKGCPFAPRCEMVVDKCLSERPPLFEISPDHKTACWVDIHTGEIR